MADLLALTAPRAALDQRVRDNFREIAGRVIEMLDWTDDLVEKRRCADFQAPRDPADLDSLRLVYR